MIAAASTDKCALCKAQGADITINYSGAICAKPSRQQPMAKALMSSTTPWAPATLPSPLSRSIAWRGRYLIIGFASGPIPSLPLNLALLKKGASLVGVFWGDFAKREPHSNAAMMRELAQWYSQGKIKPVIDCTMPMSELFAAYERMGSRQVQGKLSGQRVNK